MLSLSFFFFFVFGIIVVVQGERTGVKVVDVSAAHCGENDYKTDVKSQMFHLRTHYADFVPRV